MAAASSGKYNPHQAKPCQGAEKMAASIEAFRSWLDTRSTRTAEAWTAFWAEQEQESRCLARSAELCQRLDTHWAEFASRLAPSARVIDLGCGGGAVGRALRAAESRLHVTGIDIAQVPQSAEPGIALLSGVRMEELPFAGAAFGAAASQFGFEYGVAEAAANEVARVLA